MDNFTANLRGPSLRHLSCKTCAVANLDAGNQPEPGALGGMVGTTIPTCSVELEAQLHPRRSKGAPRSSHLSTELRNAVIGGTNDDGPRWSSYSPTLLGRSHHLACAHAFRTRWVDSPTRAFPPLFGPPPP